jgi:hypothetical protein
VEEINQALALAGAQVVVEVVEAKQSVDLWGAVGIVVEIPTQTMKLTLSEAAGEVIGGNLKL